MFEKANKEADEKQKEWEKSMEKVLGKNNDTYFFNKLLQHNKPLWWVVIGGITQCI